MPSFIIAGYVWQILGWGTFLPPIREQPRKGPSWIGLSTNSTKWSNTLKQFVRKSRPNVWVCLCILWGWSLRIQVLWFLTKLYNSASNYSFEILHDLKISLINKHTENKQYNKNIVKIWKAVKNHEILAVVVFQ